MFQLTRNVPSWAMTSVGTVMPWNRHRSIVASSAAGLGLLRAADARAAGLRPLSEAAGAETGT